MPFLSKSCVLIASKWHPRQLSEELMYLFKMDSRLRGNDNTSGSDIACVSDMRSGSDKVRKNT